MKESKRKLSQNKIPLPEHLHWKLTTIVEVIEGWRVIHHLLSLGHKPETVKALYPTIDDDYFKLIINYFKQYGTIDIETVFNSILTDYRKNELRIILERMINLDEFTLEDINTIIPEKSQKELLSPNNWLM
ncbi:hypothetical protein P9386_17685 [Caldifermentibacillus hisashii]|uniref:hypothetical protein n=1 Tax=Caldifermentibacillus hisashii TaxID=996558 RepID=UPI002E20E988|nr:hypothetical protein [Caldifermentibacillus hisashii]